MPNFDYINQWLRQKGVNPNEFGAQVGYPDVPAMGLGTFEAEAYPQVLKALGQITAMSKRAEEIEPPITELGGNVHHLSLIYDYLRRYKQAVEAAAGTGLKQPTWEQLKAISEPLYGRYLPSEAQGGARTAEEHAAQVMKRAVAEKRGLNPPKFMFDPDEIESNLGSVRDLLKRVWGR